VVGLLVVLALALVRNQIPVWIRTGLTGLGLGALLFGLVWPYLIGPLGSGPGALIVAVGSAALAVSGILALVADRHEGVDRSV
jgi:predicted membrane-bound spermidine synthase